jgi:hypothetical protein
MYCSNHTTDCGFFSIHPFINAFGAIFPFTSRTKFSKNCKQPIFCFPISLTIDASFEIFLEKGKSMYEDILPQLKESKQHLEELGGYL